MPPSRTRNEIRENSPGSRRSRQSRPRASSTTEPTRIPRPPNCFMLYRQDAAEKYRLYTEHPHSCVVSCIAGELWKTLPEDEKKEYKRLAEEERLRHEKEHPDYKLTIRKAKEGETGEKKPKTRRPAQRQSEDKVRARRTAERLRSIDAPSLSWAEKPFAEQIAYQPAPASTLSTIPLQYLNFALPLWYLQGFTHPFGGYPQLPPSSSTPASPSPAPFELLLRGEPIYSHPGGAPLVAWSPSCVRNEPLTEEQLVSLMKTLDR